MALMNNYNIAPHGFMRMLIALIFIANFYEGV